MSDYTFPPSPTDTFLVTDNDGETICIDIQITDDDDYEADHQFAVRIDLSVPPSVAVAGGNALVTIMDNNGKCNVRVYHSSTIGVASVKCREDCVLFTLSF